jgi:ATP/maltotriose-dependent transcriptional regulator MalT
MNILVIEENLSRRKIIHRKLQLTKIQSQIVLVKNFGQAMIYLKNSKIDLVIINTQVFNAVSEIQKKVLKNRKIILLNTKKDTSKSKYLTLFIEAEVEEYKNLLTKVMASKPKVKPLSKRENEILFLISHGLNNKKITKNLKIQDATIKTHLRRIRIKLHTENRAHSVAMALRQGLIT